MFTNIFYLSRIIWRNYNCSFKHLIKNERQSDFLYWGKQGLLVKEIDSEISLSMCIMYNIISFDYRDFFSKKNRDRVKLRVKQLKGSYVSFKNDKLLKIRKPSWAKIISYCFKLLKFWFFSCLIGLFFLYYFFVIRLLPFNKTVFNWIMLGMFFYWFMSGFVFFAKKYKYTKFTSVIQRFWKRSYIVFWLIEASLFIIFFYLTINASMEPFYFYDSAYLHKQHLFSWRLFFLKNMILVLLLNLSYFLLINIKWNPFNKIQVLFLPITFLLIYVTWIETYQIYHIIQFYGPLSWVYDTEERLWNLEGELKRTRIVNHYVAICFLAKYFHVIFILIFWIFFALRCFEQKRVHYTLLSANIQNFIFLYIMSWVYMYPWFKFYTRRYLNYSSKELNLTNHNLAFKVFFSDLNLYLMVIFEGSFSSLKKELIVMEDYLFYYWHENTTIVHNTQFVRNSIRDLVINKFS